MKRTSLGLALALILAGAALVATAEAPAIDATWSQAPLWDDGQAEIAFYQVERSTNQYGRAAEQSFPVGTYLVKHGFDPATQSKSAAVDAESAFKWALFYEFESGAYQYKRSYVVNAATADLRPLKASFTSFDWCSNLYRELAFLPDGTVESLMRSDDYGNGSQTFSARASAFPVAMLPVVLRGLDFSVSDRQSFQIVLEGGRHVDAVATLAGRERVVTGEGELEAEKIELRYAAEVPSIVGEWADSVEHYWRGVDEARLLLRLAAASGRYNMTLIETTRSAYWQENFFPRLRRVTTRP